jgi:transposase InsO family protein
VSNATAVHQNSPLTPTGRLRLVERHLRDGIPIAHVAAEFRVAWDTAKKWIDRYLAHGQEGLVDRSSVPVGNPQRTAPAVVERIEALRRALKWSARRIHAHLAAGGMDPLPEGHRLADGTVHAPVAICLRTVGRWLARLGISRLRNLTPHGDDLRQPPRVIDARRPGYMVHLDVKKLGTIPDGGGWAAHGRGTQAALRGKRGAGARVGYTYLHSAIDGYSRLAYTEALADERAATTIGFWYRARAFFTAHGISIDRVITDNGNNYRATDFTAAVRSLGSRHHRIRPYTPKHNGKIERYNRLMVDEVLYARPYASETDRREALQVWTNHYNYHRPHTACHERPPASRTPAPINNVMPSYI